MTHSNHRLSVFLFTLSLVFAMSALMVFPVLADDGAPPPASPAGNSPTASTTTSGNKTDLFKVPSGTDVVVVNRKGAHVPLASQEAAKIVANGDPIWCPTGVAPIPGVGGCTASQTKFIGGLLPLINNESVNGTIWIESLYDNTPDGAVAINGSLLGTTPNFTLTIKGGWDGSAAGTIVSASPSIFLNPFSVTNWNNDVTLSDIELKNIAAVGPTGALIVTTSKGITLTRTHIHNNSGTGLDGAYLDSTLSGGTGNVSVSSSEFDVNYGDNLYVLSNGTITLTNVIALGSTHGSGAILHNNSTLTPKNVTVTGNNSYVIQPWINGGLGEFVNTFNGNVNDGLQVLSNGVITLGNITASKNGTSHLAPSFGAEINNDYLGFSSGVTLTGVNIFNENYKDGLLINSRGAVTASNLTAESNGTLGGGVEIDNHNALTAQPVTLTGSSNFKYNSVSGLSILSNGQITLNNLISDKNGGSCLTCAGVYLANSYGTFTSGVKIAGTNEFVSNYNHGLHINSNGVVSLSSLTANNNGNGTSLGYAVFVDNTTALTPKSVSITGTNSMDLNRFGLSVNSNGAISVNSLTVSYSGEGPGASLKNDNFGAVGGVTLSGVSKLTNNYNGNGLVVTSFGAISLNSVTANSNGYSTTYATGISLDNHLSLLAAAPGVTLSGTNQANSNGINGVDIQTRGAVKINSLNSGSNGYASSSGSGLNVVNTFGTAGVTLTGTNVFNSNYDTGIKVLTNGPISLSNVTADYNSIGRGADLDNTGSTSVSPQNVSITGINEFTSDQLDGLKVQTYGAVSLSTVTANYSALGSGAVIDNSAGTIVKNVTLSGTNYFSSNHVDGLDVTSLGKITISNLSGNNSTTGHGASLNNSLGSAGVTLTGTSTFQYNYHDAGLYIFTKGAIALNNISAYNNGDAAGEAGIYLDNSGGSAQPVTLTGTNYMNNNYDTGLFIRSAGFVTINNLTSSYNGTGGPNGYGLEISNLTDTTGVKLTGTNNFYQDLSGGLLVSSKGAISLDGVSATYSTAGGAFGASLSNLASTAPTPQNVSLTGTNTFSDNDGTGLIINTFGAISLSNVTSNDSTTASGAVLNNSTGTLSKSVTFTGSNNFNYNQVDGLVVTSLGAITAGNLEGYGNSTGRGAFLDNHLGSGGVTLTGNNLFSYNSHDTGLTILSRGAITLNHVVSSYNGNGAGDMGVKLDNSGAFGQPVTLTGSNTLDNNFDDGLYIKSAGLVTLNNLESDYNGYVGAVHGYGLEISNAVATTGVKLTGSNYFYYNYNGGLIVSSMGAITLNNISATSSQASGSIGASLNNLASTPGSPQNVTITGTSDFSSSDGNDLVINTYGAISLSNITAEDSLNGNGVVLNNGSGTILKSVTLTGSNYFSDNHLDGLDITTLGGVTANTLTVNYNDKNGAVFTAGGNVMLTGTSLFYGNSGGVGLSVQTAGAISLNNVTSSYNYTNGVSLVNTSALAAQSVTLTGSILLDHNNAVGLFIRSNGAVKIANLTVINNDYLHTLGVYGADIDNTNLSLVQPVTLTGFGSIINNYDIGMVVNSLGAITLNNMTANSNYQQGLYLVNTTDGQGVKLTGTNSFNSNSKPGLVVSSHGAITLNNVTASSNSFMGVQLDNFGASTAMAVTITGTNTFNNNTSGLSVVSKGTINLNNITANYNTSGAGVTLNNSSGTAAVTLTGVNTFLQNSGSGLVITSAGNVSITKVRSDGNVGVSSDGVTINTSGAVTFTCGILTNNGRYGVNISNASAVTLIGVIASGNPAGNQNFSSIGTLTKVRVCPLP